MKSKGENENTLHVDVNFGTILKILHKPLTTACEFGKITKYAKVD